MIYRAAKFDPDNDPTRPKVGDEITKDGAQFVIGKVEHTTLTAIIEGAKEPELKGFQEVVYKEHETRPAVLWVLWINAKQA